MSSGAAHSGAEGGKTIPQTGTAEALAEPAHQTTLYVILNAKAGTALAQGLTPDRLRESFERREYAVVVDASDEALESRIDRALTSNAGIIVSAGGDGTATLIASRLVGTDKALAVLPLGTANLLARDLGIPMDVDAAIAALETMEVRRIDVAEINGRVFLHKVVVGTFPDMAVMREKVRGQATLRSAIGFARYFVRRLGHGRRMAVAVASHGRAERIERVHAIAIANNAYDEGWAKVFHRSRLDAGCLTLYALKTPGTLDIVRLLVKMIAGRWREDQAVSIETVHSVTLRAKRSTLRVMIDGEVELLETPFAFTIRPAALNVLAPAMSKADTN